MNPIAITGIGVVTTADEVPEGIDATRLRRMDRYGKMGFLAGSLALRTAGFEKASTPDPRSGAVFGTMYGCRDAIVEHARLLAKAKSIEDLSPAVFAATVHNTVLGELAIEWGLGGVSEVIVSGRGAGLQALLLAARRISDGSADRILVGGAEGLNESMRAAWAAEQPRGAAGELEECGVAFVLERGAWALVEVVDGLSFFEPMPERAVRRIARFAKKKLGESPGLALVATPDPTGRFGRELFAAEGFDILPSDETKERFGAAGPDGVRRMVEILANLAAIRGVVVTRDRDGATSVVALRRQ